MTFVSLENTWELSSADESADLDGVRQVIELATGGKKIHLKMSGKYVSGALNSSLNV